MTRQLTLDLDDRRYHGWTWSDRLAAVANGPDVTRVGFTPEHHRDPSITVDAVLEMTRDGFADLYVDCVHCNEEAPLVEVYPGAQTHTSDTVAQWDRFVDLARQHAEDCIPTNPADRCTSSVCFPCTADS